MTMVKGITLKTKNNKDNESKILMYHNILKIMLSLLK